MSNNVDKFRVSSFEFRVVNAKPGTRNPKQCRDGQAVVEYALLLALVSAALLGMQLYAKRGVQAGVKMMTDGVLSPYANDTNGELAQRAGIAYESGERRNRATTLVGNVLKRRADAQVPAN